MVLQLKSILGQTITKGINVSLFTIFKINENQIYFISTIIEHETGNILGKITYKDDIYEIKGTNKPEVNELLGKLIYDLLQYRN